MQLRTRSAIVLALALSVVGGGYAAASTVAGHAIAQLHDQNLEQQGLANDVPWSAVGAGWILADWNTNKATNPGEKPQPGYLSNPPEYTYLVSPQGARYLVEKRPNSDEYLADWSGDGQFALLLSYSAARVVIVDLETGIKVDSWKFPAGYGDGPSMFSRPKGLAVLMSSGYGTGAVLRRYSLSGTLERVYPREFSRVGGFDGRFLPSPDGTQIILGTASGISVVDNDGAVVRQYGARTASACDPVRWWAQDVVLASCSWNQFGTRLYEFNLVTGAVGVLTAPSGRDNGSGVDAWAVGGRVYVQTAGPAACSGYFGVLARDHTVTPFDVPGVHRGQVADPVGASDGSLAFIKAIYCGGSISVLWFNPAADTSRVVLGPPLMSGGITGAILFPAN
jgi:TolB protein